MKRFGLFAGAALVALGLGTAYIHAQNTSGGPGPFAGRGGPGRPGGPFGPGPGGRGPGGPGGFLHPMMMERLKVTDAQREQIKSAMDSHRDDVKTLGDRGFQAREALQAAVTADAFDESTIRAASANVATVEADMAVLQGRIHSELWQILTPEQQKAAKELRAQREQRRADGRERRQGRQEDRRERREDRRQRGQ